MANAVNHDLSIGGAIEDQIGIGKGDHTPQPALVCQSSGLWILQQKIDDCVNALFDMASALWRLPVN